MVRKDNTRPTNVRHRITVIRDTVIEAFAFLVLGSCIMRNV